MLLGKQRFEHAAGFFLLAGRLKDAVEVCIRSLNDLQLALVIVRLYESDFDKLAGHVKSILFTEVLGYTLIPESSSTSGGGGVKKSDSFGKLSDQPNPANVSQDPFLRSLAYWQVKDYRASLNTLYDIDIDVGQYLNSTSKNKAAAAAAAAAASSGGNKKESIISHVFNFYTFLKHHPLLLRQQMVEETTASKTVASSSLTPIERRLHFVAAYCHLINGCPLLTLDILSKLPKYISPSENNNNNINNNANEQNDQQLIKPNPKVIEKAEDFDWSTPNYSSGLSKRFEEEELDLGLSDEGEDEDDNDQEKLKAKENTLTEEPRSQNLTDENKLSRANAASAALATNEKDNLAAEDRQVDTFAQQIKFISCLKILIEEMSTLSTGFEVVGGQLRYYMYYWLERETQLLRELGDYSTSTATTTGATGAASFSSAANESSMMLTLSLSETTDEILDSNPNPDSSGGEHWLKDDKWFATKVDFNFYRHNKFRFCQKRAI